MARAILLHKKDNVATALTPVAAGEDVEVTLEDVRYRVRVRQDIPFAHKFALAPIAAGDFVFKYGLPIGKATRPIGVGEHVHSHNLVTNK